MNWYYLDEEKVIGPLSASTMKDLSAGGVLESTTLVRTEHQTEWQPFAQVNLQMEPMPPVPGKTSSAVSFAEALNKVADGVSDAAGLERLRGQEAKGLLRALFTRRTQEEMEDQFAIGTHLTTPALDRVSSEWPAPWVFMRLVGFSVFATVMFSWAIIRFGNPILYPGWLFMGAFGIPVSVMVFFLETNVLRNISIYRVLKLFLLGGLMSLVITLLLFEATGADRWFGAMAAGPVEETSKLLAVVFVARKWSNTRWTLNGMLLGAAVGAGFSSFETAGYIFGSVFTGGSDTFTMILRAFCSPFTHVIWTAATAGALWRHMEDNPFSLSMLGEWKVLRILLIAAGLHTLWNSPLRVPFIGEFPGICAKFAVLGIVGWLLVLMLIQEGLNQVRRAVAPIQTPTQGDDS